MWVVAIRSFIYDVSGLLSVIVFTMSYSHVLFYLTKFRQKNPCMHIVLCISKDIDLTSLLMIRYEKVFPKSCTLHCVHALTCIKKHNKKTSHAYLELRKNNRTKFFFQFVNQMKANHRIRSAHLLEYRGHHYIITRLLN